MARRCSDRAPDDWRPPAPAPPPSLRDGQVIHAGRPLAKPGLGASRFTPTNHLLSSDTAPGYRAERVKLVHALETNAGHLTPPSKICLDIGASTGGFTEVLLANGAAPAFTPSMLEPAS